MLQTIRTTITLPLHIHEEWRMESVQKKIALGDLILEKARVNRKPKARLLEKQMTADFSFFDEVGRMGDQIDMVKALREDRDRDND